MTSKYFTFAFLIPEERECPLFYIVTIVNKKAKRKINDNRVNF